MVEASGASAEREMAPAAVLTAPLSLNGGLAAEIGQESVVRRVLGLFRNVLPGADLSLMQLPPTFNLPKSQLQLYGESIYCTAGGAGDYLSRCSGGTSSLERFIAVVAWSISTTRPGIFGLSPFNPVLGETHHVSRGSLNLIAEQVSHHPPISAVHATDDDLGIELLWCQHPDPKFHGTGVEAAVRGKRHLRLRKHGESYEMESPRLWLRFLPTTSIEWCGRVRIVCRESGLEAELFYRRSSIFSSAGERRVKGKVFNSATPDIIFDIDGHWDRTIWIKDLRSESVEVLYDAKQAIANLKTPLIRDPTGLSETESAVVWGEVSRAILRKEWAKASEAKSAVEERQRAAKREMAADGRGWTPRHFSAVSKDKQGLHWECRPLHESVPPAPIIVPS